MSVKHAKRPRRVVCAFFAFSGLPVLVTSCTHRIPSEQLAVSSAVSASAAGASIDVEYIEPERVELPAEDARLAFPVKFVCGDAGSGDALTPAHYRTLINVLNVGHGFSAVIQWWFVTVQKTVQGAQAVVMPTSSLIMDCDFILRNLANEGVDVSGLVEGFVLLEEAVPRGFFRVSAVYSTLHKQRHPAADLVPVRKMPGYCSLDDQRRLLVTIGNLGEVEADASTTTVTLEDGLSVTRPTPVLAPGAETILDPVLLPGGEGTVTFKIEADSSTQIFESDELNNTAYGFCTFVL